MKKLIRIVECTDENEKEAVRKHLNELGFYCLTSEFSERQIVVFAIEEPKFILGFKL